MHGTSRPAGGCARRAMAFATALLFAASLACGGGGKKEGPPQPKPEAPLLAPLPEVVNAPEVTVRGRATPGLRVVVHGGTADAWGEAASGTGNFAVPVPLAPGQTALRACAVEGGVESDGAPAAVTYAAPTLALASATPAAATAGSYLTLAGSGFGTDPAGVKVYFGDGGREMSAGVLEASDTSLRTIVPFAFLDSDGQLAVYVARGSATSGTVAVAVAPAQDATPLVAGDQTRARFAGLAAATAALRTRLEAQQAVMAPEVWAAVAANLDRIEQALSEVAATWVPQQSPEALALLDRVFSTEVFREADRGLEAVAGGAVPLRGCGAGATAEAGSPAFAEAMCDLGAVHSTLGAIAEALGWVLNGCRAAMAICAFVCHPALPVLEVAIAILDPICQTFGAILTFLDATVPDHPADFHLEVESLYQGGDPWVVFTGLTNRIALRIDLSNGGYRSLARQINFLGALVLELIGFELPPPYTVENQPVGSVASFVEAEPRVSCRDGTPRDAPEALGLPDGATGLEWQRLVGGVLPAGLAENDRCVEVAVLIHGSCGSFFDYPERVCPASQGSACQDPPPFHRASVIEAPVIFSYGYYANTASWAFEGVGYSTDVCGSSPAFVVYFNDEPIPCECLYVTTTNVVFGRDCPEYHQVGRLRLEAVLSGGERRSGPEYRLPPVGEAQVVIDAVSPASAFVGDVLTLAGRRFGRYVEDASVAFRGLDGATAATVSPDEILPALLTPECERPDLLRVGVPEPLYRHGGQAVGVHLAFRPTPDNGLAEADASFQLMPSESARWLDQDVVAYGGPDEHVRAVAVGDFDGDGENDLAVGAPGSFRSGQAVGAVYLLFGPRPGLELPTGQRVVDLLQGGADAVILGDPAAVDPGGNRRSIGSALAAGDVNGDGIADLLVGSTDQDERDLHRPLGGGVGAWAHLPARAWLFPGRSRAEWQQASPLRTADAPGSARGPAVRIGGDPVGELGYAVAVADLDGDEVGDLVLGDPTDPVDPAVPNGAHGMTYVVFGAAVLPPEIDVGDVGAGVPGAAIRGPTTDETPEGGAAPWVGNGLGKALAAGDVNGDGVADLLIGAPESSRDLGDGWGTRKGAAFLFLGGPSLAGHHAAELEGGDAALRIAGPPATRPGMGARPGPGRAIGRALAIGDLTPADPVQGGDLVLGAPDSDEVWGAQGCEDAQAVERAGAVYVLAGADLPAHGLLPVEAWTSLLVRGSASIARLGASLAVADLDGDGLQDLVAGAPRGTAPGRGGAVWILRGEASPAWRGPQRPYRLHLVERRLLSAASAATSFPFRDALVHGELAHPGRDEGFGRFLAVGDFGPYSGKDLLVVDPIAEAPGPRAEAGSLYVFFEGPRLLNSHTVRDGLVIGSDGTAPIGGVLDGAGDEAGFSWPCDGREVGVTLDLATPRLFVVDQRSMILGQGAGALTGVATPASGECGLVVRSTEQVTRTFAGTLRLGSAPAPGRAVTVGPAQRLAAGGGAIGVLGTWAGATSNDLWVASLGADLGLAWQIATGSAGGAESAGAIASVPAGGWLVAGEQAAGDAAVPVVARVGSQGEVPWQVALTGGMDVLSLRAAAAPGGAVALLVTDLTPALGQRTRLYGLDPLGAVAWATEVPAPAPAGTPALQIADVAGGASGVLAVGNLLVATGDLDGWVAWLDAAGAPAQQLVVGRAGGGAFETLTRAAAAGDGGYAAGGSALGLGPWVVRLAGTGGVAWQRLLSGMGPDVKALAGAADGALYVAGEAAGGGGDGGGSTAQVLLVRLTAAGEVEWARAFEAGRGLLGLAPADGGGALVLLAAAGAGSAPVLAQVTAGGDLGCGLVASVPVTASDPGPAFAVRPAQAVLPQISAAPQAQAWSSAPTGETAGVVCAP